MFRKGHKFVKLSSFLIWDMMMIPCGRCTVALRTPRAHFSWQAQYFAVLEQKVPETRGKYAIFDISSVHFFVVREMICENLTRARASVS